MCVDFYTYDVRECRAKRGATVRTNGHPKPIENRVFSIERVSVYQNSDYKRKSSCNRGYPERCGVQWALTLTTLTVRMYHAGFIAIFVISIFRR